MIELLEKNMIYYFFLQIGINIFDNFTRIQDWVKSIDRAIRLWKQMEQSMGYFIGLN